MRPLVGMFLPLFCVVYLETSNGLMLVAEELMMLNRLLLVMFNAEHYDQFVLALAEAQRVYGAARESHNESTRNILKHSTCSHKWWETLRRLDLWCKTFHSCSHEAQRLLGGGSC